MFNTQVAFKAKIPVSEGNVYDRQKNKFEKAKVYEIDGKSFNDIQHVRNEKSNWLNFRLCIQFDLLKKIKLVNFFFANSEKEKESIKKKKFYTIENNKNELIGVIETHHDDDYVNISLIECNPDSKYKYTGQVLIAGVVKELINKGCQKLTVEHPTKEALGFYTNACGFKPIKDDKFGLELNLEGMRKFIDNVNFFTQI